MQTCVTRAMDLLLTQVRRRQCCLMLVTHDPAIAQRADRLIKLVRQKYSGEHGVQAYSLDWLHVDSLNRLRPFWP